MVLGLAQLGVAAARGHASDGVVDLVVLLVFAAVVVAARAGTEAGTLGVLVGETPDERGAQIWQRSMAFTGQVLILVVVGGLIWTTTSGGGAAAVVGALASVGGITLVAAFVRNTRRG